MAGRYIINLISAYDLAVVWFGPLYIHYSCLYICGSLCTFVQYYSALCLGRLLVCDLPALFQVPYNPSRQLVAWMFHLAHGCWWVYGLKATLDRSTTCIAHELGARIYTEALFLLYTSMMIALLYLTRHILDTEEQCHVAYKDVKQQSCTVCLDDFSASDIIHRLACDHSYHCACIHLWLRSKNTCPICRECIVRSTVASN